MQEPSTGLEQLFHPLFSQILPFPFRSIPVHDLPLAGYHPSLALNQWMLRRLRLSIRSNRRNTTSSRASLSISVSPLLEYPGPRLTIHNAKQTIQQPRKHSFPSLQPKLRNYPNDSTIPSTIPNCYPLYRRVRISIRSRTSRRSRKRMR